MLGNSHAWFNAIRFIVSVYNFDWQLQRSKLARIQSKIPVSIELYREIQYMKWKIIEFSLATLFGLRRLVINENLF